MVVQMIIQSNITEDEAEKKLDNKESIMKFDPDNDGFNLPLDFAFKLHNNTNLLFFIRRNFQIVHGSKSKKEPKAFLTCLPVLVSKFEPAPFSDKWTVRKHDLALLKFVSKEGLKLFEPSEDSDKTLREQLKNVEEFADLEEGVIDKLDVKQVLARVEEMCKGSREEPPVKGIPIKRPAPLKTTGDAE